MASDARLMNIGRLQEKEHEARHLAVKIHGLRQQIRTCSDPFKPIEDLDVTAMRVSLDDLVEASARYEQLLKEIALLREDLGMPRYEPR